jgi:hypothetical protein
MTAPFPVIEIRKSPIKIGLLLILAVIYLGIGAICLPVALLALFAADLPVLLVLAPLGILAAGMGLFLGKQAVMVLMHPNPVLTLAAEGLRLNFSADVVPYEKVRVAGAVYIKLLGMILVDFSSPIMLRFHHFPSVKEMSPRKKLRMICTYEMTGRDIADEIERRRKPVQQKA